MDKLPKRIAIIYDWLNKWGGAEQVLINLSQLFPNADLYSPIFSTTKAQWVKGKFSHVYIPKFGTLPWVRSNHEYLPFLLPLLVESFNFNQYDCVISVSSFVAKGVITNPHTFHLNYCLTPTRFLWSHEKSYKSSSSKLSQYVSNIFDSYLRDWDQIASNRPDAYVGISQTVNNRIKKYYGKDSDIVYPPVDSRLFNSYKHTTTGKYFLWVGRFVNYKKPIEVIQLFNKLNLPLVMVGDGKLLPMATKLAHKNITIKGSVTSSELTDIYSNSKAFVTIHEEDFGLVLVESLGFGKPVVGIKTGGAAEIIHSSKLGLLAESNEKLEEYLINFDKYKFDPNELKAEADKYSSERFQKNFAKVLLRQWQKYNNISMS